MTDGEESITVWQPLREPVFRAMWTAALVSNVGTWMQNVGAAWLMTSLTTSALLVALVQTATTLPVVLVSLPAGAIGDIVDRRWLLLVVQAWMLVTAVILSGLTAVGATTPLVLLLLTFSLGIGTAFLNPTWQAIQPELVPRKELPAAISLGAVGFNIARAVGPAVGGLILAATGTATVFFLNAVSFVAVLIVVYRWEREPAVSELPPERLSESIYRGVRFVRNDPDLRSVLIRTVIFIAFASAIWALLPLLVRNQLGLGAGGYGIVLGVTGLGSAAGITVLERARQRFTTNQVVIGASALFGLTLVVLGLVHAVAVALVAVALGGLAWISVLSSLNTAVQTLSPEWVRARTLSVFMLCFLGGMAVSSLGWGVVADHLGTPMTFVVAGLGLLVGLVGGVRWRFPETDDLDLRPSQEWSDPQTEFEPTPDAGPILVSVEYRIDPTTAADFLDAMRELEGVRRRNGARYWNVFRDTETPDRYFEVYVTGTWMAHLREHERVSVADREIQKRATSFHVGDEPPEVTHFVSEIDG
ncbi:MFS transporter [Haladaptatus sp. CMAA 1909]|uniref:MFS transporter n=1 Tax=Haladaptatus sp. CMAA 1909 TaxID=3368986 RepID=UPI003754075E